MAAAIYSSFKETFFWDFFVVGKDEQERKLPGFQTKT
jgi:hypothetical protein